MGEALSIAYRGVLWAVVLAWMAFAIHKIGWNVIPVVGLPIFSAWVLGENRGYRRGFEDGKIFGSVLLGPGPGKNPSP